MCPPPAAPPPDCGPGPPHAMRYSVPGPPCTPCAPCAPPSSPVMPQQAQPTASSALSPCYASQYQVCCPQCPAPPMPASQANLSVLRDEALLDSECPLSLVHAIAMVPAVAQRAVHAEKSVSASGTAPTLAVGTSTAYSAPSSAFPDAISAVSYCSSRLQHRPKRARARGSRGADLRSPKLAAGATVSVMPVLPVSPICVCGAPSVSLLHRACYACRDDMVDEADGGVTGRDRFAAAVRARAARLRQQQQLPTEKPVQQRFDQHEPSRVPTLTPSRSMPSFLDTVSSTDASPPVCRSAMISATPTFGAKVAAATAVGAGGNGADSIATSVVHGSSSTLTFTPSSRQGVGLRLAAGVIGKTAPRRGGLIRARRAVWSQHDLTLLNDVHVAAARLQSTQARAEERAGDPLLHPSPSSSVLSLATLATDGDGDVCEGSMDAADCGVKRSNDSMHGVRGTFAQVLSEQLMPEHHKAPAQLACVEATSSASPSSTSSSPEASSQLSTQLVSLSL